MERRIYLGEDEIEALEVLLERFMGPDTVIKWSDDAEIGDIVEIEALKPEQKELMRRLIDKHKITGRGALFKLRGILVGKRKSGQPLDADEEKALAIFDEWTRWPRYVVEFKYPNKTEGWTFEDMGFRVEVKVVEDPEAKKKKKVREVKLEDAGKLKAFAHKFFKVVDELLANETTRKTLLSRYGSLSPKALARLLRLVGVKVNYPRRLKYAIKYAIRKGYLDDAPVSNATKAYLTLAAIRRIGTLLKEVGTKKGRKQERITPKRSDRVEKLWSILQTITPAEAATQIVQKSTEKLDLGSPTTWSQLYQNFIIAMINNRLHLGAKSWDDLVQKIKEKFAPLREQWRKTVWPSTKLGEARKSVKRALGLRVGGRSKSEGTVPAAAEFVEYEIDDYDYDYDEEDYGPENAYYIVPAYDHDTEIEYIDASDIETVNQLAEMGFGEIKLNLREMAIAGGVATLSLWTAKNLSNFVSNFFNNQIRERVSDEAADGLRPFVRGLTSIAIGSGLWVLAPWINKQFQQKLPISMEMAFKFVGAFMFVDGVFSLFRGGRPLISISDELNDAVDSLLERVGLLPHKIEDELEEEYLTEKEREEMTETNVERHTEHETDEISLSELWNWATSPITEEDKEKEYQEEFGYLAKNEDLVGRFLKEVE
mgnify:CR=1 FL=1